MENLVALAHVLCAILRPVGPLQLGSCDQTFFMCSGLLPKECQKWKDHNIENTKMGKFKGVKSLLYISLNLEDFYGKDLAFHTNLYMYKFLVIYCNLIL